MARTITRWEPFSELADMRSRFDHLLGELTDGGQREWTPPIDVIRENDLMTVRADVPGIKPDEMKIEIEGGVLTISGEHEETTETKRERFIRRERHFGSFARTIQLPDGVDAKKVKATAHDGMLEVRIPLPKAEEPKAVTITPTAGE